MSLFRPPAEAHSLILRILQGCPWNQCTFCGMYKTVQSHRLSMQQIEEEIERAARSWPAARRIFLADGDVMALPFEQLESILSNLNQRFPRLARVNSYANGHSILQKSDAEFKALRTLKLNTLYMGLESGDPQTLISVKKRETAEEMVEAAQRAQRAGLKMSVMILIGLAGRTGSQQHAEATANALNRMQPRLLSALRVIPIPGTELYAQKQSGAFDQLTEVEAVEEIRHLIAQLDLNSTLFRANHTSNILPLEGRFPKDQPRLLHELSTLLASNTLDRHTPGPEPLSL